MDKLISAMQSRIKHIHLIGVGGVGMGGIAEVLLNLGYQISGTDLRENALIQPAFQPVVLLEYVVLLLRLIQDFLDQLP